MLTNKETNSDGIIIILSYPDTVVRPAYWERLSNFWPKIGIGSKHAVQAGHSALLLIKKNSPEIKYFDFGRYITSYGNGRVRSYQTDPELNIPIKAVFKESNLQNIDKILLWLEKHPEKTHGNGRLVASINHEINYNRALSFINSLINKNEFPYGAFIKDGSNCARFVADTLINSCTKKKIQLKLKSSYLLTPSPIGNTLKGKTFDKVFLIKDQKIINYTNKSILKEYKASFFNKFEHELDLIGTELPNPQIFKPINGTWLSGIGSGAWFKIEERIEKQKYRISRYTVNGIKDFEGVFITNNCSFDLNTNFVIKHPTNCKEVHISQNEKDFVFKLLKN